MTYEEGKNISLIEELAALGNEMGLEGVEEMLRSDRFKSEVLEEDDFAKFDLEIQYGWVHLTNQLEESPTLLLMTSTIWKELIRLLRLSVFLN